MKPGVLVDAATKIVSPQVMERLKALNRLRWITKYRIVRDRGEWRAAPLQSLIYILLDPELESYTYELDNLPELIKAVAGAFDLDPTTVAAYCAEVDSDPELCQRLSARVRWRPETKRRLPLGQRVLWYAFVRLRKPALVVETGVLLGLGSLAILRALERNAEEGAPGRLISVDVNPAAGWLVPEYLREHWTPLTGFSCDLLPDALARDRVAMLFNDSSHEYENQLAEFGLALARADLPLILVNPDGDRSPALEELCERHGGQRFVYETVPRRHFHRPAPTAIGVFRRPS